MSVPVASRLKDYWEMTLEELWEEYYKNETQIVLQGLTDKLIGRETLILRWIGFRNDSCIPVERK